MPAIKRCEDCGPDSKPAPFTFGAEADATHTLLLEESEGRTDAVCRHSRVPLRENGAMTKTEYAQYTQSEHWQQRRKQAIADAFNQCERCDLPRWIASLIYDQDLHVHHRNYQNLGDEQSEDLEVLCRRCHDIETFGRSDFREIKKAECSLCYSNHFNVYSDYCNTCQLLMGWDRPDSAMWHLGYKVNDKPLWVDSIYAALMSKQILITDLVVVIGRAIQQIDADYEAYLASRKAHPELENQGDDIGVLA
jgi:5-methylcytosine-specific restriction endonuclease McrA